MTSAVFHHTPRLPLRTAFGVWLALSVFGWFALYGIYCAVRGLL